MTAIDDLNPEQRAAVEHGEGALLVIAGAGSGKTRVLTARVAHLIARGVAPESILAFTFTNRAAREMRERIARAVGDVAARLWVGTFHATGVRILRREAAAGRWPGRSPAFVIYDREDQLAVVEEVLTGLGLPEGALRPGEVLRRISDAKNSLVTAEEFERVAVSPHERRIAACYHGYRQALASGSGNVFAVGDEDQSIYGWRGADISNVLDFEDAFPGTTVLRLEQNYRSTANILRAANAVIENNRDRKGKRLWCDRGDGARLSFVLAADEQDEARRIGEALRERVAGGGRLDEAAVLYRTNAQSRALETELRRLGMRYEIVGGVSFYARREVKDLLAYLRLALNPADRVAFWRVWNTPRRGLGDAVRARLETLDPGRPLEALRSLARAGALRGAARGGAESFLGLIDELTARIAEPPAALLRLVLERVEYLRVLEESGDGDAADRRANVEELVAAALAWEPGEGADGVAGFLAESALITDADRVEEGADRVLLLTAHNAKGLEFPMVVVAGLEEGLFPHASALEEAKELEEERRLFYVALTRARERVLLTAAAFRRRMAPGGAFIARGGQVSRFVDEIPAELLDREESPSVALAGAHASVASPRWGGRGGAPGRRTESHAAPAYRTSGALAKTVGREVHHETFGRGVVVMAEGEGSDIKFTVRFGTQMRKVLGRFLSGGFDVDQP